MNDKSSLTRETGETRPDRPILGYLLLAALTLIWGVNWPIMKIALGEFPPWTFRALHVPTGGLVLLLIVHAAGMTLAVPRDRWLALASVSFFNVPIWYVAGSYGIINLTSGRAALVAFTMPLWASLLAVPILGEKLTVRRLAALGLGIAGIAVLMGGAWSTLGNTPLGVAFMLTNALSWALGTVLLKRINWRMSTLALTGWQLTIGGIPIVIGTLLLELDDIHTASFGAWAAVAYTTFLATSMGTYAWFKIVSLFPAGVSAVGTMLIPVVGVVSGNLVLGEPLGWREATALALISSALAINLIALAKRPAS